MGPPLSLRAPCGCARVAAPVPARPLRLRKGGRPPPVAWRRGGRAGPAPRAQVAARPLAPALGWARAPPAAARCVGVAGDLRLAVVAGELVAGGGG